MGSPAPRSPSHHGRSHATRTLPAGANDAPSEPIPADLDAAAAQQELGGEPVGEAVRKFLKDNTDIRQKLETELRKAVGLVKEAGPAEAVPGPQPNGKAAPAATRGR